MPTDILQIVSVIAQTILAVATFILALVIYNETKRDRYIETSRTIQASWNEFNNMVLEDDDCLKLADLLINPSCYLER